MISNQILQNTIEGLKGISRVDFCVLDTEGKELAATFESGQDRSDAVLSFVESPADSQVIQGCQFFKIFDEQRLEYVLLISTVAYWSRGLHIVLVEQHYELADEPLRKEKS